jgi:hypothetical protein
MVFAIKNRERPIQFKIQGCFDSAPQLERPRSAKMGGGNFAIPIDWQFFNLQPKIRNPVFITKYGRLFFHH